MFPLLYRASSMQLSFDGRRDAGDLSGRYIVSTRDGTAKQNGTFDLKKISAVAPATMVCAETTQATQPSLSVPSPAPPRVAAVPPPVRPAIAPVGIVPHKEPMATSPENKTSPPTAPLQGQVTPTAPTVESPLANQPSNPLLDDPSTPANARPLSYGHGWDCKPRLRPLRQWLRRCYRSR